MPYPTLDSLPDAVKKIPVGAQHIFQSAFNSALDQYKDEGKAFPVAWAAVKTKYKQNEKGDWIAKEANVKESMSADDKRNLLQTAIDTKFPSSGTMMPSGSWISDVYDTEVVYRHDGVDYKAPYVIDTEGKVTLGEPVKVKRQTVYTPMESLRRNHADIIQEIGRRNAAADEGRIQKIMSICQELLSKRRCTKGNINEALKEADSVSGLAKRTSGS